MTPATSLYDQPAPCLTPIVATSSTGGRGTRLDAGLTSGSPFLLYPYDPGTVDWSTLEALRALFQSTVRYEVSARVVAPRRQAAGRTLTCDDSTGDLMSHLEALLNGGDHTGFLNLLSETDWEKRPVGDIERGIQLALAAGDHGSARAIAERGSRFYPTDTTLLRYAEVLAPPRVKRLPRPPTPGLEANRDWLMANGDRYRGVWVALRSGQLIGSATSLKALADQIGDVPDAFLTKG